MYDASPPQAYPQHQFVAGIHLYTWVGRDDVEWDIMSRRERSNKTRGLFLKSPENFSGTKSQLSNCNPLVLKSWSFNMFLM